jgi:predicted DNA-binding transcriptional regulator YafY
MKNLISKAMQDPDNLVIELQYTDRKQQQTRRVVSPIRFVSADRFMALCLCREEPRIFTINDCRNVSLKPAWDYLMPVELEVISPAA